MKSIKNCYENLKSEETIFFQIKNKKKLIKFIDKINKIVGTWNEIYYEYDKVKTKNYYFILGKWRDGMFNLRQRDTDEHECHILADTKEHPWDNLKHQKQIAEIINLMDKDRQCFIQKRVEFDNNFNIVKKTRKRENNGKGKRSC